MASFFLQSIASSTLQCKSFPRRPPVITLFLAIAESLGCGQSACIFSQENLHLLLGTFSFSRDQVSANPAAMCEPPGPISAKTMLVVLYCFTYLKNNIKIANFIFRKSCRFSILHNSPTKKKPTQPYLTPNLVTWT